MKKHVSLLTVLFAYITNGHAQLWNPYGQLHTGSNIISGKKVRPAQQGLSTTSFMPAAGIQAGNLFHLNDRWFIETAVGYTVNQVVLRNSIHQQTGERQEDTRLRYTTTFNNFYVPLRVGTTQKAGTLPGRFLISAGITGGYTTYMASDILFGSTTRGGSNQSGTGMYDLDLGNSSLTGYRSTYVALGISIRNNPFRRCSRLYIGVETNWQLQYSPAQFFPVNIYGIGGNEPVISAYHLSHRTLDVLLTVTYLFQGTSKGKVYQYDRHNF